MPNLLPKIKRHGCDIVGLISISANCDSDSMWHGSQPFLDSCHP